jgi:hypothetical protein
MDISTLIEYLYFLQIEASRFLEDSDVEDEEIQTISIELTRFKEKVKNSKLPIELKDKIETLSYTFNPRKLNLSNLFYFISIITIGAWAVIFIVIQ